MAKKQTEEVKETEVKVSKKAARRAEIAAEKEKYEVIIDKLIDEKYEAKKNKDKAKVKELNAKIKEAKQERSLVGSTDTFGGQVRAEMRLVRWPSTKEVVKYTIAVLGFIAFFAAFFFLIDFLFSFITGLKG